MLSKNPNAYNGEPLASAKIENPRARKVYIESYGCQMNFSDSEIVASIMNKANIFTTSTITEADFVFLNTCAIRAKAEQTIWKRLETLNKLKRQKPQLVIGLLGCMAERLKAKLLENQQVDLVVGPDAYRDLPQLIQKIDSGHQAVNVLLSREETYADIAPVRLNSNGITAFISIMRGCNNMCSFCVVPFTRGRERSRPPESIIAEAKTLFEQGYREITLLGQNVDSYNWKDEVNFAHLLAALARLDSDLRIRFSTSHPKDITDEVLFTMKTYPNICKYIHLPAQSGNNRILKLMNRTYTREWYLERVRAIKRILGEACGISSDMITGFCSETEAEHRETLSLMDLVRYDFSYMFAYSERPNTPAARKLEDDIPIETKKRRLQEVIAKQQNLSLERNRACIGKTYRVLIEGYSKRSKEHLQGRNSANKVIVFPKANHQIGTYVEVKVQDCTSATLIA